MRTNARAAAVLAACAVSSALPAHLERAAGPGGNHGGNQSLQDSMQNVCSQEGDYAKVLAKMFPGSLKLSQACTASLGELQSMSAAGYTLVNLRAPPPPPAGWWHGGWVRVGARVCLSC